jgi:hypothetical protein
VTRASSDDRGDEGLDAGPVDGGRAAGATFAPARIERRGRAPILMIGIVLGIGGLAIAGVLDQLAGTPSTAVASLPAREIPPSPAARPVGTPERGATSGASDVIQLDIRPTGKQLVVHGEVFSLGVIAVVVSIEDVTGRVGEVRSIDIQGGSTAFRLGANERFDAYFDVPEELVGNTLWVRADAYDAAGRIQEAVLQPIVASPLGYRVDPGSRAISDVWTRFDE